jgi:hypothetical protein
MLLKETLNLVLDIEFIHEVLYFVPEDVKVPMFLE